MYEPTNWKVDDIITAEKLNKAEQGIADASVYIVPVTYDSETGDAILGASFKDIYDAVSAGHVVMTQDEQVEKSVTIAFLTGTGYNDDAGVLYPYDVTFTDGHNMYAYHATTETDALVQYQV